MPLSNTTQEILRTAPYWDDYARDKRFHRILFKPRLPVQTRELNQIQSLLQNQVEQVTSSIYREGVAVIGGQQTFSNTALALQVVRTDAVDINNFYDANTATGAIVTGTTSGAKGVVTQVTTQVGSDYAAIIISPLDALSFVGGESLQFSSTDGSALAIMQAAPGTLTAPVTTPASTFSIEKGVFYLRGHLVDVPKQTIIVSTTSNSPSKRVGFTVAESIVTSATDGTLLDPALGSTNYAAPGADRLQLTATLTIKDIYNDSVTPNAEENFVELVRVIAGVVQPTGERLEQTFVEDTLARRTYDESGDYVVTPFQVQVKDHNPPVDVPNITGYITGNLTSTIITAANTLTTITYANGATANVTTLFTSEVFIGDTLVVNGEQRDITTVTNNTQLIVNAAFSKAFTNATATVISPNKVNVELSAGTAYVRGYEVRTTGTTKLAADRARTTNAINNGITSTSFGPYVIVTQDKGMFNINTMELLDLHCLPSSGIQSAAVNSTTGRYMSSRIGKARVRSFSYYSGIGDANTTYKMYLVGAEFETKTLSVNTTSNAGDDVNLTGNTANAAVVVNAATKTLVLRQNTASSAGSILAMDNNAYVGAIVQLYRNDGYQLYYPVVASSYTGNSTTLRVQTLTLNSDDQLASVNTTANVQIIFSDKCIRGMSNANTLAKLASVSYLSKVGLTANANTMVENPTSTGLLFKYRENTIKPSSISDESYSVLRYLATVTGNSGSTGVVGFTISAETAAGEVPSQQTTEVWRHMLVVNSDGTVVNLTSANAAVDSSTILLSIANTAVPGGATVSVYAPMDVGAGAVNAVARLKTFYTGNTNLASVTVNATGYLVTDLTNYKGHVAINNITATSNAVVGLGVADVAAVKKIYAVKDANTIATNASAVVDVTNNYTLDNGQRDWCYDHASIVLKPGYVHYTTNCAQMLVIVDRFSHSTPNANLSFFNPSSYRTASNTLFALEDIPTFTNPKTRTTLALSQFVDFRPVRVANAAYANTATNPYNAADTTFETTVLPLADASYRADYQFYLSRIDKVVVTKDRKFRIITGLPSRTPEIPADSGDGITLYLLSFPAYTESPTLVNVRPFEYKRYTMKDIGRLEKRIENLEYYASLSTIDLQALNTPELDQHDNERFKNGIVTDNFSNDGVRGSWPETKIAIDRANQEMRPSTRVTGFKLEVDDTATTNMQTLGTNEQGVPSGLVSVAYSTQEFLKQPLASSSININPFNVFSWRGVLTLLPSSDTWIDTITKPDVIINLYNQNDGLATGPIESHYNYWEETFGGAPYMVAGDAYKGYLPGIGDPNNPHPQAQWATDGVREQWLQDITMITPKTTNQMKQQVSTVRDVSFTTTDGGERIVDTSVASKMRGVDVDIIATGLLPNAQLRATFDEVDVTAYVERSNRLVLNSAADGKQFYVGDHIVATTGGRGRIAGIAIDDTEDTAVLYLVDASGVFNGGTISVSKTVNYPGLLNEMGARVVTGISVQSYTHYHGIAQSVSKVGGLWKVVLDTGAPNSGTDLYTGKVIHFTDGGYQSKINLLDAVEKVAVSDPGFYASAASPITPSGVGGVVATISAYDTATRTATLASLTADVEAAFAQQQLAYTTDNPIRYSIGMPQSSSSNTDTEIVATPGAFYGLFRLPGYRQSVSNPNERVRSSALQFNTGQRVFKLKNISNNTDSQAAQSFSSQGSTVVKQNDIYRTRNVDTYQVTGDVSVTTVNASTSSTTTQFLAYIDPLAETFLVDVTKYPSGVFITGVDLFFAKKGTSNIDVKVQLRRTKNGYPSADDILAESVVPGSNIHVIPDGDTPTVGNPAHVTHFAFSTPQYLAPNAEYAITVMSDSNEYEVFVGEIGQRLLGTNKIITAQPFAGSFFKSQNARTWVAEPLQDLMFVLHCAKFDVSESYLGLKLANSSYGIIGNTTYDALNVDLPHLEFSASANGSQFTYTAVNLSNTASQHALSLNTNLTMTERMKIDTGVDTSLRVRARVQTTDSFVSPVYDLQQVNVKTITNVIDNGGLYAAGFAFTPGVANTLANAAYSASGNSYTLAVTGGNGTGAVVTAVTNTTGYVTQISVANTGYGYTATPTISLAANTHFTTQPTFTYVGETSANSAIQAEQKARYTTRSITLADGFDAADLKVYLSAFRAPQHNIDVYYKVLATGDPQTFAEKPWVPMVLKPEQAQVYATSASSKREYEYRTAQNTASYVSNGVTFTRFHTFAVKVVLRSGTIDNPYQVDTVTVPRISNLRCIALDE